jgi:antitoxin component YwqK of YwqJK toxin-antitoxin module
MSVEETYKDGKFDGKATNWWKNGQKKQEATYKNGEQIEWTEWDEDGNER